MLKGGILEIFHGKNHNFWLFLLDFPEFEPGTFRSWGERVIHLATEAKEFGPKKFSYINPIAELELGTTEISHFIAQLKVPGSKLNAGEGKKILRKSICFLVFLGS